MKLKVLGVNGGNGVILYPFIDSLLGNIEPRTVFHTPADIQWKLNFKGIPFDSKEGAKYRIKDVGVIIGAPDCGHSSVLSYSRKKSMGNPKENASIKLFINSINFYQPTFFLMENLPKLLENWGSDLDKAFAEYRLIKYMEPVSAWGNSQITRIRLVIVGIRKDHINYENFFKLPLPSKLKTESQLLSGLRDENITIGHVREPDDYYLNLYVKERRKITVAEARKYWMTNFAHLRKWPVNDGRLRNQPGVSRNFADDYPFTVRKQNRQFSHRGYPLSPREMARIQGIPDDFKIWYTPDRKLFCINKGRITVTKTPPYEIGKWFYECLNKIPW